MKAPEVTVAMLDTGHKLLDECSREELLFVIQKMMEERELLSRDVVLECGDPEHGTDDDE
jgi:hypothetical protein